MEKFPLAENVLHFNLNFIPKRPGIYIVGGTVRDAILGLSPRDYDIAVFESPERVARQIALAAGGRAICIGKPGKQVFRVVTPDLQYDVTAARGRCIEDDLRKRDFTINAMAVNVERGEILDPLNGWQDLQKKIIHMVSGNAFSDDPLRLLRAFRIAAILGFAIEPETMAAIGETAGAIGDVSGERVREEWLKLSNTPGCYPYILEMSRSGLLCAIFPELVSLRGVSADTRANDLFTRSLGDLEKIERLLEQNQPSLLSNRENRELLHVDNYAPLLKYAALLHRIGEPFVPKRQIRERKRFLGIGTVAADMALDISNRMKMSNQEKRYTDILIRNSGRPFILFAAKNRNRLKGMAVTRFFMKTAPVTPDLLLLSVAADPDEGVYGFPSFVSMMLDKYLTEFLPALQNPALITGHDLVGRFGLPPSPLIAELLACIETRRLAGRIRSRAEAFSVVKKILDRQNHS